MKYDIAMHLLANGIIEKEQYELVSRILSGVRINQDDLEEELEYKKKTTYNFTGKLPNSDDTFELEMSSDDFFFNYKVSGLYFEVTQNPKNQHQIGLYVVRENLPDQYRKKDSDYYLITKRENEDFVTVRYYDKEAYNFVRKLEFNLEFLELDDFEKVGIIPDEEVVLKDVDAVEFARKLIAPYTRGEGKFEDVLDEVLHPGKQKVKE